MQAAPIKQLEKKRLGQVRGLLAQLEAAICGQFDRETTALFATARIWDDGVIDPRDTRRVLSICLATCSEARRRTLHPNSFGVARG